MTFLGLRHAANVAGIAALLMLGVACGEEDPKPVSSDDDVPEGETDSNDKDKDKGEKLDAAAQPPAFDGALTPPPAKTDAGDAGSVSVEPPPPPPPPPPPADVDALKPLQADGGKKSVCYDNSDCTGDNLSCFRPLTAPGPGVCLGTCSNDTECEPLEGVNGMCREFPITGKVCQYGCAGPEGDGKGPCPSNMVCHNFGTQILLPDWQCSYPANAGKKTAPLWGRCDTAHGPGDCAGDNICTHPEANLSSAQFPSGYCSPKCTQDSECVAPGGATAVGSCFLDACRLACDNGETCPAGQSCFNVAPLGVQVKRCLFVD